ncbi:MAG: Asp-tRNA(Asn)/Glu-tRNA(Gln) amidotransferase subunit GatB [Gammaproteobacteria bacterium]|jgi:aspartyl-tRNA(Asn)/glutamyl-tRNA(Gln) amidotransferase subunit B|nr:Asp-tRNA(Asn)/Glu-tRNA(Gln) amidotransferase subunit GatB [Gammaproteobacteria bacterium]MBT5203782.1 Asp-tRNA(Asn)/Glu-tRNA(Gln) amidotransferase subunit GatB [Gammaproteobacteria bacterium]MBT5600614.1 Asp-tRNA(Asn)/Glu-tRNA(Gln) amidotransferase subunit GatB [Gammaproteobacteria bacterium]MBT6245128.1 Asp-tRNA(Asn)/Glu-tRNA(Gln) amidotransferase subunit GatB [Gammaproteobacteria bacterium]
MNIPDGWQIDIGLEIHAQLNTQSKIFSGASTLFGSDPNIQASAVDLALPGVLPVVNEAVYAKAIRFGLGVSAEIARISAFDRKNYFYPDLPKGYQITQMDLPIVTGGHIDIFLEDGTVKRIRITRAHLEEDAGKSLHEDFDSFTGIDLNRAGTPLLEIVSEPDIKSAYEAVAYARKIHQLVTYLDICDGNMSQGSLRFDANISVRREDSATLGIRAEIKNLNSFRFLERAIVYETDRQISLLEANKSVPQETRLYDPGKDETRPMRSKETATDYRYFPEPDLLPVVVTDEKINAIKAEMPELPAERCQRFIDEFKLTVADSNLLASDRNLADYFEIAAENSKNALLSANWVKSELLGHLNRDSLSIKDSPVSAIQLGELVSLIGADTISGKIAKDVFSALWAGEATSATTYIEQHGLQQLTDQSALEPLILEILNANPKQRQQLLSGKHKLMGFFVGQVMKQTQGKANPQQVNTIIKRLLQESP